MGPRGIRLWRSFGTRLAESRNRLPRNWNIDGFWAMSKPNSIHSPAPIPILSNRIDRLSFVLGVARSFGLYHALSASANWNDY
jgi:hypothetical protein